MLLSESPNATKASSMGHYYLVPGIIIEVIG